MERDGRCQGKECKGFTQNGAFMSYVLCMDVLWEYGNSLNFSVCTSVGRFSLSYCPSISVSASASYPECPIFVPVFRCLCLSISCRLYLHIILSLILCLSVYLSLFICLDIWISVYISVRIVGRVDWSMLEKINRA